MPAPAATPRAMRTASPGRHRRTAAGPTRTPRVTRRTTRRRALTGAAGALAPAVFVWRGSAKTLSLLALGPRHQHAAAPFSPLRGSAIHLVRSPVMKHDLCVGL